MIGVNVQVQGFEQMLERFRQLGPTVEKTVLRRALKQAGEVFKDDIARRAPTDTGTLARSIATWSRTKKKYGEMKISVGPSSKKEPGLLVKHTASRSYTTVGGHKWKKGVEENYFYPAGIEYGTIHHPAKPFMRPSFEGKSAEVARLVEQELWHGIERAMTAR